MINMKYCLPFIASLNDDQRRLLAGCCQLSARPPISDKLLAARLADALALANAVFTVGRWPDLS